MNLSQGDIVLMQHRDVTSLKPHFFLVLNKAPDSDEKVLLLITTSRDKEIRRAIRIYGMRPDSCVEVGAVDCAAFSHTCYIDCNHLFTADMATIDSNAQFIRTAGGKVTQMSQVTLGKILHEVGLSPRIERRWKDAIL